MAIEEIIDKLRYSKCDCPIDYKEELGIVNGVCPKHAHSVLLVNGVRLEVLKKAVDRKGFDRKPSEIV